MLVDNVLDVLNNLCNILIDDGQVPEEVIEILLDAGANVDMLRKIGFTDDQISDYAYYEANMSGRSESDILAELYNTQK